MTQFDQPKTFKRFSINQVLAENPQSAVYLATDPNLKHQVIIKSIRLNNHRAQQQNIDSLLSEARQLSRLKHPNIVAIYELGIHNQQPFLALEYVAGESLRQKINNRLTIDQCTELISDILSGIGAAHTQSIIHADLKPENILINADGDAKIADLGLSQLVDASHTDESKLYGTPQYMAPEYIETRQNKAVSDVFSLGLIFYEMLTRQPAVNGDDVYQIFNAITNTDIPPPSTINPDIDKALDRFIMKALEKNPDNRYLDANVMLDAFNQYNTHNNQTLQSDNNDTTIQFLLRRMRKKGDFPVFSQTISQLNKASASDTDGLAEVSNSILQDYALTNKVLRLVNSVHYSRGGGKVNTISRAVVMLGINSVRSIAASLMLFEHLQNKQQSQQLKENTVKSLFCALVANQLAASCKVANHEEAFLCALLEQFGQLLSRFYLPEETQAIDKLMAEDNYSEQSAVKTVLGTSYHKLGISIAREWGFPTQIIESMKPLDFDHLPKQDNNTQKLRIVSQFSNALGRCLQLAQPEQKTAIEKLTDQFSVALDIDKEKVSDLIISSHEELAKFSQMIDFDLTQSQFFKQASPDHSQPPDKPIEPPKTHQNTPTDGVEILEENLDNQQKTIEKALSDGIQDITNTLTGDFTINQIMQMVIETIYRALEKSRVILCLKDAKTNTIRGRFGYGDNIDAMIRNFSVPLDYHPDVFHIAFKNNVDIRIDNTQDPAIKTKIPDWYHKKINARSFTIFPILIKHSPIALIYIDNDKYKPATISDNQLGLLKTLRNQLILAIKSSS